MLVVLTVEQSPFTVMYIAGLASVWILLKNSKKNKGSGQFLNKNPVYPRNIILENNGSDPTAFEILKSTA